MQKLIFAHSAILSDKISLNNCRLFCSVAHSILILFANLINSFFSHFSHSKQDDERHQICKGTQHPGTEFAKSDYKKITKISLIVRNITLILTPYLPEFGAK
jgi:hypothetical protein